MSIEEEAQKIVDEQVTRELGGCYKRLIEMERMSAPVHEIADEADDANSWLRIAAGGKKELYDDHKLRVFRSVTGRVCVIQGKNEVK